MEAQVLPPGYQLSIATEDDAESCMDLVVPIFNTSSFGRRVIGIDSPETRRRAAAQHIAAWKDHRHRYPASKDDSSTVYPLKITHTNSEQRSEIVAFAEWYIFPRERTAAELEKPFYLHDAAHVSPELREEFAAAVAPSVEARKRVVGTKPHAMLMYLCVPPEHRAKGLGTACVKWGMNKCVELGILGYLLSSAEGNHVYSSLGWETVEVIEAGGASSAVMTWQPVGTKV